MSDDLTSLEVSIGDDIRAEDHNALVRAISRRRIRGGPGVLIKQFDDHTSISYTAPRRSLRHAWKPSLTTYDGKAAVTFSKGLINGVEPTVGGFRISADNKMPLVIDEYDEDLGDCLVFAELDLDLQTWAIRSARMIASPTVPKFKPFTARKLIAVINEDGSVYPRCFFDLGFAATNRKPNGVFRPWWWLGGTP